METDPKLEEKLDATLDQFVTETKIGNRWHHVLCWSPERSIEALSSQFPIEKLETVRDLLGVPGPMLLRLQNIGWVSLEILEKALRVNGLPALPGSVEAERLFRPFTWKEPDGD